MARNMDVTAFASWFPFRIYRGENGIRVQWFRRDAGLSFEDRYFHDTVSRAAKRPFNLAFYRETGPEVIAEIARSEASLPLHGLLFHLSRCGSTLISNAFAARYDVLVLAEPGPVNDVLRLEGLGEPARIELLRQTVAVLARPQRTDQQACVIKTDAWHVRSLPLFLAAYPDVPWFFVHREPSEVLVSHLRTPSFMMSPGNAPSVSGLSLIEASVIPRERYCALAIAGILDAVRRHAPRLEQLVSYEELPDAIWERIGPTFALPFQPTTIARIRSGTATHAKDPTRRFVADGAEKRAAAESLGDEVLAPLRAAYEWYKRPTAQ